MHWTMKGMVLFRLVQYGEGSLMNNIHRKAARCRGKWKRRSSTVFESHKEEELGLISGYGRVGDPSWLPISQNTKVCRDFTAFQENQAYVKFNTDLCSKQMKVY